MAVVQRCVWVSMAWLALAGCDPSPFEIESPAPRADAGVDSSTAESQRPDSGPRDASVVPEAGGENAGASGSDGGQAAAGSGGHAGMSAAAGSGGSAGEAAEVCQRADPDAAVSVKEVSEAGTVSSPASIALRIPGPISWIGGKLTWLFPKTIRKDGALGADTAPNQPNAAFLSRDKPNVLEEDLDPDGVPRRFLTADDENATSELWPTALLRVPPPTDQENTTGLAFVRVSRDLINYDVAVGRVSRNTTTAQEPLTPLFAETDSKFSTGGFRGNEYGYLFACQVDANISDRNDPARYPCKVARAKLAELTQRDSYRVYDPAQEQWVADLSAGAPVIYGPPGMLSLSFNNYLGRYIAVHSRWFSNDVVVQTATMPAGPWREELSFTLPAPSVGVTQSALEQPALIAPEACAKTIWVSYMSPTADTMGYPSAAEIKLVKVELQ
jgi:hypothetical protein